MVQRVRKKRKTYDARVEFRAVQDEVVRLMAEGYRIKAIFDRLSGEGRLTVCYTTFCDYIRGGGERIRKKAPAWNQLANQSVQSPRSPVKATRAPVVARLEKNAPFSHDKDVDIKDLV